MVRLTADDPGEMGALLTADDYRKQIGE
jgi:hypothetical protein